MHHSFESKETIIVFYPATSPVHPKEAVMLGFAIADANEAEHIAKSKNFEILEPMKETPLVVTA